MLKLYNEAAQHEYVPCDNAKICYRRIKPGRYAAIIKECAPDDRDPQKVDWDAVMHRVLDWAILSWAGIGFDESDGDAEVSPTNIELLPQTVKIALYKLVLAEMHREQELKKDESAVPDPLGSSADTSKQVSTSAGDTAGSASETT